MKRDVELDIVDLAYNGKAVGYLDGKVTFVNGGLPGERVAARITRSKRRYNQAALLGVLKPSPDRIAPECRHHQICGGCTWQDLDYQKQLVYKRNQVIAALEHIGRFSGGVVVDIHPSPERFFYRNKMEFSFHVNDESPRGFVLGLHERGRFDRIFDLERCHLQSELSNNLVNFIREKVAGLQIPVYDLVSHHGFLRFLVVREGKKTGQVLLVFVTSDTDFAAKEQLLTSIVDTFPEVTTIVQIANPTVTNIAKGTVREVLYGPGHIEEEILGFRFRINPGSFFQTNSRQTEALYRAALDLADLRPQDTVLDLYCGAGTIGLCAAKSARWIIGIEIESDAIDAARINARINEIDNARFLVGEVRRVIFSDDMKNQTFDRVFVDPPRAGMHPEALRRLLDIKAPRIVYISCNPATFARDARMLADGGYSLETVIPFDMFPHTMHIEVVAAFQKNG